MSKLDYHDYPLEDCVKQASERATEVERRGGTCDVYQKWTCQHCGSRQTMEKANSFHRSGICEACKQTTVIARCNYMMHIQARKVKR